MSRETNTSKRDLALLSAFIQTFEYYQLSKNSRPIEPEHSISLLANPDEEAHVQIRIDRAAQMRKFTFSPRDSLYISKVIEALDRLQGNIVDSESQDNLSSLLEELRSGNVGPISINESQSGVSTPDSQIVRDAIHGLLLHGDMEKLNRHLSRHKSSINLALFSWLNASERLCHLVYAKAKATIQD